jgi:alkanesulfonate monooxygenase SsuD/methylene tetrahydromethanopterin reductase-like flavin-dependent oxidoreductase (luciferase family)
MKVGLFVNTQFPEGTDVSARVPETIEQVRTARDAGFKSLWFPHHWLTHPMQMMQITPVMAYVAAHAQGMTIGPNILILPPLNPVHVAEEAATLDVLTGGNYILGIGLGYRPQEFTAFGVPLSERAPRLLHRERRRPEPEAGAHWRSAAVYRGAGGRGREAGGAYW